jgi:hypothetical protein
VSTCTKQACCANNIEHATILIQLFLHARDARGIGARRLVARRARSQSQLCASTQRTTLGVCRAPMTCAWSRATGVKRLYTRLARARHVVGDGRVARARTRRGDGDAGVCFYFTCTLSKMQNSKSDNYVENIQK